jgi:4-phosphopantoate---beta-alanine ligase
MSDNDIPDSHPRANSLRLRHKITDGVAVGITSELGLIAHGRGEAFDYLLGEETKEFAIRAIEVAASTLLLSSNPVISVNGNVVALVPNELVELSETINAPLEVNIFHTSEVRQNLIAEYLKKHGAKSVLLPEKNVSIPYIESNRKYVNSKGIAVADTIFVPLEDGDRAQALIKNGKKVISIDLNPLSRTAIVSTVTIVDNVVRVMSLLIEKINELKNLDKNELQLNLNNYSNKDILREAEILIRCG